MIHTSRRKILALFTAAPAALPVALKEAAEKAGIGSITAMSPLPDAGTLRHSSPYYDWDQQIKWIKNRLLDSNSAQSRFNRSQRAEERAHCLNPNLAALRSVSPAVAYRIEYDRQIKVMEENDRLTTNFELVEAMRQKAMGNT